MVKITDLTALTSADSTDVFAIDDVSATTTKKITMANVAASIPASSITTAMVATSAVTHTKIADGLLANFAYTVNGAVATGTTVMPDDDTVPQNTEGVEFMTLAYTPKSTTNLLEIEVVAMVSSSVAGNMTGALFQDSTADALNAGRVRNTAGSEANMLTVKHVMVAGTTSSTTFKFRCGNNNAGTTTFNGAAGARVAGAIAKSSITIKEFKAS